MYRSTHHPQADLTGSTIGTVLTIIIWFPLNYCFNIFILIQIGTFGTTRLPGAGSVVKVRKTMISTHCVSFFLLVLLLSHQIYRNNLLSLDQKTAQDHSLHSFLKVDRDAPRSCHLQIHVC